MKLQDLHIGQQVIVITPSEERISTVLSIDLEKVAELSEMIVEECDGISCSYSGDILPRPDLPHGEVTVVYANGDKETYLSWEIEEGCVQICNC